MSQPLKVAGFEVTPKWTLLTDPEDYGLRLCPPVADRHEQQPARKIRNVQATEQHDHS
jgi:hypothetical protein